jgi:DNA-binding GntR family transcriptional regulator
VTDVEPTTPTRVSLSRRTLADQIAEQLRRDILFGVIGPEDRLTQESVCQRFDTSRIPVRDAMQRLMHEGLLEATSSGLRVVSMEERDFDDIFLIEAHLHALAAELMVQRASDEEIAELVALNDRMRAAHRAKDYELVARLNGSFHHKINVLAKSPSLIRLLRANSVRIDRDYLARFPHRTPRSLREHDAFLKAVLARDTEKASDVLRAHIFISAEALEDAGRLRSAVPRPSDEHA